MLFITMTSCFMVLVTTLVCHEQGTSGIHVHIVFIHFATCAASALMNIFEYLMLVLIVDDHVIKTMRIMRYFGLLHYDKLHSLLSVFILAQILGVYYQLHSLGKFHIYINLHLQFCELVESHPLFCWYVRLGPSLLPVT